jgi:hypothetical protein
LLAGCGGLLGIEDFDPPSITGALRDLDNDNIRDTKVVFFDESRTKFGETITGADGTYVLPLTAELPVNGLNGYFELNDPRYVHTFSYLLTPALDGAKNGHEIVTLTSDGLRSLADTATMPHGANSWIVVAAVIDDQGGAAIGATVEAVTQANQRLAVCYTDQDDPNLPCGGSSTGNDGLARIFDVPENVTVTVSAINTEGGSHTISFPTAGGPGLVSTPVPPAE